MEEYSRKGVLQVLIEDEDIVAHIDEYDEHLSEKNKVKYKALEQVEPASNQNDSDDNASVASAVSAA